MEISGPKRDLSHSAVYLRLLYGDTYGLPFIQCKSDILFYHKYPTLDWTWATSTGSLESPPGPPENSLWTSLLIYLGFSKNFCYKNHSYIHFTELNGYAGTSIFKNVKKNWTLLDFKSVIINITVIQLHINFFIYFCAFIIDYWIQFLVL